MARNTLAFWVFLGLANFIAIHVYGDNWLEDPYLESRYRYRLNRMKAIKASFLSRDGIYPPPSYDPQVPFGSHVHRVTTYGADPTGRIDSTESLVRAISVAFQSQNDRVLMPGLSDLGGAQIHLEGGTYKISRPLRLPAGRANVMIHGGSIQASPDFPPDRHLIELDSRENVDDKRIAYEDITLKDLLLDSIYRGGGIAVVNSLRTIIDNCYITHFTTNGVLVQGGHETFIRNSFLGQHITAGGDRYEKDFSGVAINLNGNDNVVTDVVIFSAAIGVLVSGQANILTGVHCYNKATGWGGTGIYLRVPGLTQTRIVNCYLDYTGIIAEDPVQVHISGSFFLGDAYIVLKSVKGTMRGINIVNNMFSGDSKGVDIVQLDLSNGPFTTMDQVVIDRNNVRGMALKSTVARRSAQGNGSSWTVDFSRVLLFPNHIKHVQYTLQAGASYPKHVLRSVSENRVTIESDMPVNATVYVSVDQSGTSIG